MKMLEMEQFPPVFALGPEMMEDTQRNMMMASAALVGKR
jgi:hypothetical protein